MSEACNIQRLNASPARRSSCLAKTIDGDLFITIDGTTPESAFVGIVRTAQAGAQARSSRCPAPPFGRDRLLQCTAAGRKIVCRLGWTACYGRRK